MPPDNDHVRSNVMVGGSPWWIYWGATPEMIDMADNLVLDDPGFVTPRDPRGSGFALRPDAPALKNGLRPRPLEEIGLQGGGGNLPGAA